MYLNNSRSLTGLAALLPRPQHQPPRATADAAHRVARTEERLPAHLVDRLGRALHDVEWVVNDRHVPERGIVADGRGEGRVHVHHHELDRLLLLRRQRRQPLRHRLLAAPVTDPKGLARLDVAHDRDEVIRELVAAA